MRAKVARNFPASQIDLCYRLRLERNLTASLRSWHELTFNCRASSGDRFAGLLKPMTVQEALGSAAISSLAGRLSPERWGTATHGTPRSRGQPRVALVGGGCGVLE